jgi:hypothetical protein
MHTTLPAANYISSALHSHAYAKSRMNKYANEKEKKKVAFRFLPQCKSQRGHFRVTETAERSREYIDVSWHNSDTRCVQGSAITLDSSSQGTNTLVLPLVCSASVLFKLYDNETFFYRNYKKTHPHDSKLLINRSTLASVIKQVKIDAR